MAAQSALNERGALSATISVHLRRDAKLALQALPRTADASAVAAHHGGAEDVAELVSYGDVQQGATAYLD